jgi:hypothetical protein
MHFSITIDHATISSEKALAEFEIIYHIKACFACLGYSEDLFVEMLARYLELEHGMTVLTNEEYRDALDEAREEAYGEGRADREDEGEDKECMAFSLAYDLGYNDGSTGEVIDQEMKHDRVYMWGYKNGMAQVAGIDEEGEDEKEDKEEWSYEQWYDAGWNDGYEGKDPDGNYPVYMWGYKAGRGQRIAAMK